MSRFAFDQDLIEQMMTLAKNLYENGPSYPDKDYYFQILMTGYEMALEASVPEVKLGLEDLPVDTTPQDLDVFVRQEMIELGYISPDDEDEKLH